MRMIRFPVLLPLLGALAVLDAAAGGLTGVPAANPKASGMSAPNILSPELAEKVVVQGSHPLENPSGQFTHYGYNGDGPFLPALGSNVEATKTEPDKNTYLVLPGLRGADPLYNYGKRFLFQGHENSKGGASYLTRVNLDADGAHRVTLLATTDNLGKPLPPIDGSTWNPFAGRLLFSAEALSTGGIWQATPDYPSTVDNLVGVFGHGGFEGIQVDSHGNVWVVEDVGGTKGSKYPHARQPNSFLYRLIPVDRTDLTKGGKLQALQVIGQNGKPIVFNASDVDGDIAAQNQVDLHTYGKAFRTGWVTVHDTATDGFGEFNANANAKAAGATPFKRPENGQFRPGSGFREFYFDATGDTDNRTEAAAFGGFGAIFRLVQSGPSASSGMLTLFYKCDETHSGLDNVAFWDAHHVVFVEDAGDTLHSQRNALDSAYLFDVRVDYSNPARQPVRILAQGRDASATIDSGLSGSAGFQNDGDNEITGIHVSDGDASVFGLLGAKIPDPFDRGWRVFYTQQHGDNTTWEIVPARDD